MSPHTSDLLPSGESSPDAALPAVLVLDEVLAVLRISRTTWFKLRRLSGRPLVPEIPGLPERYSRDVLLAFIHQAAPVAPAADPAARRIFTRSQRHRQQRASRRHATTVAPAGE